MANIEPWDWSKVSYNITPSGRKIARHTSGMGSVLEINDNGVIRNILVLDAKYRITGKRYYNVAADLKFNAYQRYGRPGNISKESYKDISDNVLNAAPYSNQDINTSKQNTDNLLAIGSGAEAAAYCRSILVNGVGCDLPNINTLCRIYSEREQLDALDNTKTSTNNLTDWIFGNKRSGWTSSWYGNTWGLAVNSTGTISYVGQTDVNRICIPIINV